MDAANFDQRGESRHWRTYALAGALCSMLISTIAAILCWTDPFPMVRLANGSLWVGPWLDRVVVIAVVGSLATIILACFARHKGARIALIIAGVLLLVVSFGGWLGNSV